MLSNELKPFPVRNPRVSHAVLEMFGGDNNLTAFVLEDLQEAASGMRGNFSLLALADFYDSGASVVEVSPSTGSRVIESWGEIDTGDPEVLATFLSRALISYGNETRKAIGFWDHGSGVFDEHDPNETLLERRLRSVSRRTRSRSVPARRLFLSPGSLAANPRLRAMLHDDTNGGVLTNREARTMVKAAFSRAGVSDPVDLLFSDTCLNGMVEVLDQFKEFARVVVASEELEPGDGWDYQGWFSLMSDSPPEDAATWASQAVKAFKNGYDGQFLQYPCTLGAFLTDHTISASFKTLVDRCDALGQGGFDWLREARDKSQAFANHDTYDIRDFASRLKEIAADPQVQDSCDNILSAFDRARVASVALGDDVKDSHGLAFWFPNNRYAFRQVAETYKHLEFAKITSWTDYLMNQFFPQG